MHGSRAERPPERFNMAPYCLETGAARPADKTGLIVIMDADDPDASEIWSFGALEDAVLRIAAGLKADGFTPGDRLVIRLKNTSDYALLFFGAIAAGAVPMPTSSVLSADEVSYFLEGSGARAIALTHGLAVGSIPEGVRVCEPDNVAALRKFATRTDYEPTLAGFQHGDTAESLIGRTRNVDLEVAA